MKPKKHKILQKALLIFISIHYMNFYSIVQAFSSPEPSALLNFKSKADLHNTLEFSTKTSFAYCKWKQIQCSNNSTTLVLKVIVENMNLGGVFAPNTLTQLRQLRVLSLHNNSLTGPVPDLSGLVNLKVLFLSRNYFSGSFPHSISTLHRLKTLDLSYNMLAGSIPGSLNGLDRLYCLRLDFNRFNGSVPPFNHSLLQIFNVSHNDLTGAIPVTPTLSRFNTSSFGLNPGLCGEIIDKRCRSTSPFFGAPINDAAAPPAAVAQLNNSKGGMGKHKRGAAMVIGFSIGVSILVISLLCFAFTFFARRRRGGWGGKDENTKMMGDASVTVNAEAVMRIEEENDELEEKVIKRMEEMKKVAVGKSGSLVFCAGEAQVYTVDMLMRASAELLGRGTMGTTYKAVLDSRLIVTVKRLDGGRLEGTSQEVFEGHMESVGGLRHPNLVPLRAYFQAKDERLLVYDYHPNGSLFSLIHGSKSSRAKPLHWTSCLKIAEDTAQGLCYIHQAWRLVHGNLKSSNVLLGSDFEACLTDYSLVALSTAPSPLDEDPNSIAYKAPEIHKFNHREPTSKSDVYSFGVLLIELLTGKHPSDHPNMVPEDMVRWMRSVRGDDSGENPLEMLLDVAMACRVPSPEQRPTMWQVLKTVQEIKEVVLVEDSEFNMN